MNFEDIYGLNFRCFALHLIFVGRGWCEVSPVTAACALCAAGWCGGANIPGL